MLFQFSLDLIDIFVENIALIFVALAFLVFYFKKNARFNFMTIKDYDSTVCNDKQCVRCNKYKDILKLAFERLSNYSSNEIALEIKNCLIHTKHRIEHCDQKPNVFLYGRLFSIPVWEKDIYIDTQLLEAGYSHILEEFKNLPEKDSGLWVVNNTPLGSWFIFPLINQGTLVEENTAFCPKTIELVSKLPSCMRQNVFSNVMFSVIKPQTIITDHYGPTNIRMRCHLGLQTTPACTLTVADQTVSWEQGQCIVFDDSFLHGVEHAGPIIEETTSSELLTPGNEHSDVTTERAVLIVDLWHPDLSHEERTIIDRIFAP